MKLESALILSIAILTALALVKALNPSNDRFHGAKSPIKYSSAPTEPGQANAASRMTLKKRDDFQAIFQSRIDRKKILAYVF